MVEAGAVVEAEAVVDAEAVVETGVVVEAEVGFLQYEAAEIGEVEVEIRHDFANVKWGRLLVVLR